MAQSGPAPTPRNTPRLEVCVDTPKGLQTAIEAGADRIELCSALATGGLTPSQGFMVLAARTSPIPVHALIRPRSGDFVFSEEEIALMQKDIKAAREAGLGGVVIGTSRADGRLDLSSLKALMQAAGPLDITLHRAFDMVPDFTEALEQTSALGIRRILTSGGAPTALAGIGVLQRLIEQAGDRLSIMPGGGITADIVAPFLDLGIREIHASCSSPQVHAGKVADLGFALPSDRQTDAKKVKALKAALAR
ncbi:copper homeostasis protein CutC [uncultured Cohaesibacter sp.]|uniref:copper homeostasis protein CutC n=1 Tax=uncultured Cohaesibacter sp. TaxID=1002546 RepID=UPI0029C64A8A|nr:copper homeostasis protein CutC [uncultured Cohaesibacter sp.]